MQPAADPPATGDAQLTELIGFLAEGVAIFDADANLQIANTSFLAMYPGLQDILVQGTPWGLFLREAVNRGAMPQPVSQRLNALEARLFDETGQSEPVQMPTYKGQTYLIRLAQSSNGGFILTQSLSADRRNTADTARDVEILLRKVLEACPASLVMSRVTDGQVIYRSPAATDLLGMAKTSFAHFADPNERADFITLLLPDARVDDMQVTCLRPDGSPFPAEISARLIDYRGEDVIVATVEDQSDELAVQAKLDRQKEQLFQSEKLSALGELLAGVAHELNNPLSIIVGNAEILHEELEETNLEKRVGKLSQAAHRCVRIVRSFLSLARQEPLNLQPVKPAHLISAAIDAASAEAETAGIRIVSACVLHVPAVIADEVQMIQVVLNLLTNAVHALQDDPQGDEVRIECTHDATAGTASITVADNGPGIPDDIKTRIFDPLFTTKDVGKGTGVGLAYCHRIVTAHQGQIRLDSATGHGATFTIDLPLAPAPENQSVLA